MLGVDYIIPNYDYLKENVKRIKGIFITHGHDAQMGALSDILFDIKDLKIYGAAFTLDVIKSQLKADNVKFNNFVLIEPHKKIDFGKCSIFPISLTHTVPDNLGYVLYTPDGAIFYTGNFVFDSMMRDSYETDIGKLAYVGKQGVLCLLSESVYAGKGFYYLIIVFLSVIRETLNNNNGRILFNIFQTQLYEFKNYLMKLWRLTSCCDYG